MAKFFEKGQQLGLTGKYNAILDMKQVITTINRLRKEANEPAPAGAHCNDGKTEVDKGRPCCRCWVYVTALRS